MKTLYESILDDEDILISKSIKDSQNPFIILRSEYDSIDFENDEDCYLKWRKACKKQLSKVDLPKDVEYAFLNTNIIFKYIPKNSTLFRIQYDNNNSLGGNYRCSQYASYMMDRNKKPRFRQIPEDIISWIENVFDKKYGFEDYQKNPYWKVIK